MKSEHLLRALIREIDASQSTTYNQQGKIWVAGREITGGLNIGYHAWVIVRDPRDPKGALKTYSGKSGVGFELGIASAAVNKMFRGNMRDKRADQMLDSMRKLRKFHTDSAEYREAMQDTTWGPLLKLKNWESDAIGQQDEMFQIYPAWKDVRAGSTTGVKGVEMQAKDNIITICDNIEKAFNNYKQDVPYDPYPELSGDPNTRNSNSFAYTLMRIVNSSLNIRMLGLNPTKYPGWGLVVPGLAP